MIWFILIIITLPAIGAFLLALHLGEKTKSKYFTEVIRSGSEEGVEVLVAAGELRVKHFESVKNEIIEALAKGAKFKFIAGPVFCIPNKIWRKIVKGKGEEEIDIKRLHVMFELAAEYPEDIIIYKTAGSGDKRFRMPYHFACTTKPGTPVTMEKNHAEMGAAENWIVRDNDNLRKKLNDIFDRVVNDKDLVEGKLRFGEKGELRPSRDMLVKESEKFKNIIKDWKRIKEDIKKLQEKIDVSWWGPYSIARIT